jgi:hypothetical protein
MFLDVSVRTYTVCGADCSRWRDAKVVIAGWDLLKRAAHILATTKRRFNLAVTIGAFGNLNFSVFVYFKHFIHQWCITFTTARVDAHVADFTYVSSHIYPRRQCCISSWHYTLKRSFKNLWSFNDVFGNFDDEGLLAA